MRNDSRSLQKPQNNSLRLFIAVNLPEVIIKNLQDIKTDIPGLKWGTLVNLHLTMRFIGDIDNENLSLIENALDLVKDQAFIAKIASLGLFNRRTGTVLWAGLESSQELLEFKKNIDNALLEKVGLIPENRAFAPHITLARMKTSATQEIKNFVNINRAKARNSFPVDYLTLYKSDLTRAGAIHTPLKTVHLVQALTSFKAELNE